MLVFVVIAVTATVTNGQNLSCLTPDDEGRVNCNGQGFTSIPEIPEAAIVV